MCVCELKVGVVRACVCMCVCVWRGRLCVCVFVCVNGTRCCPLYQTSLQGFNLPAGVKPSGPVTAPPVPKEQVQADCCPTHAPASALFLPFSRCCQTHDNCYKQAKKLTAVKSSWTIPTPTATHTHVLTNRSPAVGLPSCWLLLVGMEGNNNNDSHH